MKTVRRSRACSLKVRAEGRPRLAMTLTRPDGHSLPSDGRGQGEGAFALSRNTDNDGKSLGEGGKTPLSAVNGS
jgi:hypothetical protein